MLSPENATAWYRESQPLQWRTLTREHNPSSGCYWRSGAVQENRVHGDRPDRRFGRIIGSLLADRKARRRAVRLIPAWHPGVAVFLASLHGHLGVPAPDHDGLVDNV